MNELNSLEQLLQQYQQWLEEYQQYSPQKQVLLKHKHQNIQTIITQCQQLPNSDNLENPALMQATQAFWQAVWCAQALLIEEL